jgi:hypothetical protein
MFDLLKHPWEEFFRHAPYEKSEGEERNDIEKFISSGPLIAHQGIMGQF